MVAYFERKLSRLTGPIERHCLFWAFFAVEALRGAGLPAQLQAGTAYWPIQDPETDDGVSPNRYGCEFEWSAGRKRAVQGMLPEMHCWAGVAGEDPHIVDLTPRFFKSRAIALGMTFTAPDPPDYLWSTGLDLPPGVVYLADRKAIEVAYAFLEHAVIDKPLVINLR